MPYFCFYHEATKNLSISINVWEIMKTVNRSKRQKTFNTIFIILLSQSSQNKPKRCVSPFHFVSQTKNMWLVDSNLCHKPNESDWSILICASTVLKVHNAVILKPLCAEIDHPHPYKYVHRFKWTEMTTWKLHQINTLVEWMLNITVFIRALETFSEPRAQWASIEEKLLIQLTIYMRNSLENSSNHE